MTHSPKTTYVTVENYLKSEASATKRHEYVDGRIFSMTGATKRHNIIAGNIHSIIHAHIRGSRCRVYMSDIKARIESTNSFYYPDVMVSCEAFDSKSIFSTCPVLIVEVLSRSTAAIDRREKMFAYRQLESLVEYLIIHQTKQTAELHRKNENATWEVFEFEQGADLVLESIPVGALKISIAEIYEGVDWHHGTTWTVREDDYQEEQDDDLLDW